MKGDDIRPRGTVQVQCSTPGCPWHFWLMCDDPRLPDGPFFCGLCRDDGWATKEPES